MQMASSKNRAIGPLRRTAARALAWSKGRWARLSSRLGGNAGKAARLVVLPLLFGLGVGIGLLLSQWSARLPAGFDARSGAALQLSGPEHELAGAPTAAPSSARIEGAAGVSTSTSNRTSPSSASGSRLPTLSGTLVWPADGMVVAMAGWRRHPERGDWRYLPGLELAVPSGAPVRASADGRVASIEASADGFTVVIDHGEGWSTVYGRLFRVRVQPDQSLKAGTIIGYAPSLPDDALPALAGVYGVGGAGSSEARAGALAAVRGVVTFALYHGTESVDPLSVMPPTSFRVADASPPGDIGLESAGVGRWEEQAVSPVGP